jgi:isobutyryl-CoA mutase
MVKNKRKRILLAKAGLDGHDRGIKIIKNFLIEQGYEVFYFGIYKDLKDIIGIAVQEGVDFLGLSIHSGSHLAYVKEARDILDSYGVKDIKLIVGGIIPKDDEKLLKERYGVDYIFISGTPEANLNNIADFFMKSDYRTQKEALREDAREGDLGFFISCGVNNDASLFRDEDDNNSSLVVGVTGPLSVGKSVLIDKLISHFCSKNKKVGVISIDPSDYKSGGSFLGGDRLEMWRHIHNKNVFVYSMATRDGSGGLSKNIFFAVNSLKFSGYDIIIIETIGVGQDQVAIKEAADVTILVLTPDVGESQVYKSGIMQIADSFVINKSDILDAESLFGSINEMLDQRDFNGLNRPLVIKTAAKDDNDAGIKELAEFLLNRKKEKKI